MSNLEALIIRHFTYVQIIQQALLPLSFMYIIGITIWLKLRVLIGETNSWLAGETGI